MAQKKSKAKKPKETMRQAQRRKLAEQRNRKSIVKSKPSKVASQRVEKVRVKVEPQKALPASKQKALPAGKKGGSLASTKGSRRRNINKNADGTKARVGRPAPKKALPQGRSGVSARRAMAAAKQSRAARGTTGKGVRTGQPAGAANRMYGAKRVNASVKRALANKMQGKKVGGPSRKGGLGASLITAGAEKLLGPVAKSAGYNIGKTIRKAVGGGKPTLDKDGNKIKKTPAKKKPGKSNNAASINRRLKKQRDARKAALAKTKGDSNSAILRPAPAGRSNGSGSSSSSASSSRSSSSSSSTRPARRTSTTRGPTKPTRRTSTTKGPTKSGSFYQSKGSSTKGGPTKSGSTYKRLGNNAKGRTSRLTSALSNLKVRDYKKKKK